MKALLDESAGHCGRLRIFFFPFTTLRLIGHLEILMAQVRLCRFKKNKYSKPWLLRSLDFKTESLFHFILYHP